MEAKEKTKFCQPSLLRTASLEPFFVGIRKYSKMGFKMCWPWKSLQSLVSVSSLWKRKGHQVQSLCLSVCLTCIVSQGQHTSLDQGVPSSLHHLHLGWLDHLQTPQSCGYFEQWLQHLLHSGYWGNALGQTEPIRIFNEPNELIPISTARPNETVYSTAGLACTVDRNFAHDWKTRVLQWAWLNGI